MAELWVPDSARPALNFKKADPPKLGEAFGATWGQDLQYMTLPGGAIMQFDLSKLTLADFRGMRDHYQVNASLSVLSFMMHQMDWKIECSNAKIAREIEEDIRPIWSRLIRATSQAYWAGFAPNVLQWENDPIKGRIVPTKVKDVVPELATVNWKNVDGWAPPGGTPPKIKVYDGIKIRGSQWPVPPDNTLWYPLLMENGDYYGRKLLRAAFPSWFFSILIHLFSNRYFERFGEPLPIGRADFDEQFEINGKMVNGRQAMEDILRGIRSRAVTVLPSDRMPVGDGSKSEYAFDIQYLESQMRGADFDRYMERLDEEISLALFTPVLLLRTSAVGSYNLGVGHMQMYMWMLNALADDLKEYIDRFVVKRLHDMNYSPSAPRAEWVFRPMGKENTETVRTVVGALVGKTITPDLEELSQITGMTFTEMKEVTEPPPAVPAIDPATGLPIPDADPNANRPVNDPRRPSEARSGPRGVGEARATGKKIAARLAGTADKLYAGRTDVRFQAGYRTELANNLMDAGADPGTAAEMAERFYSQTNTALEALRSASGAMPRDEFVTCMTRLIENGIEDLANGA